MDDWKSRDDNIRKNVEYLFRMNGTTLSGCRSQMGSQSFCRSIQSHALQKRFRSGRTNKSALPFAMVREIAEVFRVSIELLDLPYEQFVVAFDTSCDGNKFRALSKSDAGQRETGAVGASHLCTRSSGMCTTVGRFDLRANASDGSRQEYLRSLEQAQDATPRKRDVDGELVFSRLCFIRAFSKAAFETVSLDLGEPAVVEQIRLLHQEMQPRWTGRLGSTAPPIINIILKEAFDSALFKCAFQNLPQSGRSELEKAWIHERKEWLGHLYERTQRGGYIPLIVPKSVLKRERFKHIIRYRTAATVGKALLIKQNPEPELDIQFTTSKDDIAAYREALIAMKSASLKHLNNEFSSENPREISIRQLEWYHRKIDCLGDNLTSLTNENRA